jgi:hypothetical protein
VQNFQILFAHFLKDKEHDLKYDNFNYILRFNLRTLSACLVLHHKNIYDTMGLFIDKSYGPFFVTMVI